MTQNKASLEIDERGAVKIRPLMGCTLVPMKNAVVVAKIDYAETREDLKAGKAESIQVTLMPAQLRALGEAFLKQAEQLEKAVPAPRQ